MKEERLSDGAKKLVEVNARVRSGENVVIVTDDLYLEMAARVDRAAVDCGAKVVTCVMMPRGRLGNSFTQGDTLRLTSPRGTDLRFSILNRRANVLTNIPEPGELAPVPDIEVNVVPVEGTAVGKLVADASIPYLGIGILREPIICTVEGGFITAIEGGEQAEVLEKDLKSHDDHNCYNVAELGVGLNPNARLTGVMLEDEGVLGTIHIGIGTNHTLGGKIVAPIHYDLLMWEPTIEIDGEIVQKSREILV